MLKKVFTRGYAGLRNWLLQRLTGLLIALYSVLLATLLWVRQPWQASAWKNLFSPLWMRVLTLLFIASLLVHAWLGVRDIFKDYVPAIRLRQVLQTLATGLLLVDAVWAVKILWSI